MQKNNGNFSKEDIQKLAQSEAGKQLMALLQNQYSATADAVRSSAQSGDMEQAKKALSALLSDPSAQRRLRQLEEQQYE